jgi:hypothetical protein
MKKLLLSIAFAICLTGGLFVIAKQYSASAQSPYFRLVTGSTISQRTVTGGSVYLAPLEGVEGVPLVNGVAATGWSVENPYWDTSKLSDGAYTLTYGDYTKQIIVHNNTEIPLEQSPYVSLEFREGLAGHLATGNAYVASLEEDSSAATGLLVDGEAASGWTIEDPYWDSTSVSDGWHTVKLGDNETQLMVLNSSEVKIHGGALESGELWTSDKLHLIRNWVRPPEGGKVTLAPYTMVKFLPDTGILETCEDSYAVLVDQTDDAVRLYRVDTDESIDMTVSSDGRHYADAYSGSYQLQVPLTPALRKNESDETDTAASLIDKLNIYYTLDGTEPTLSSNKLEKTESGDAYKPIEFSIADRTQSVDVRLAWLEEFSGSGVALYEPNWGLLNQGKVTRSASFLVNYVAEEFPVVLNGKEALTGLQGEEITVTAPGAAQDAVLWRDSEAGNPIFGGWTSATYTTEKGVVQSLEGFLDDSHNNPAVTFTAPLDMAKVELTSDYAAVPALDSYLSLEGGNSYVLKTLEGEEVSLIAYAYTDKITDELLVKPVFTSDVDEALLTSCVVEYCLTKGNDDDSSTDFGYDQYDYTVLGELGPMMESGAVLSVNATVAPDEAALRKASRLMIRIRHKDTGVTFGYRIHTFTCPNYLIVNGKVLFAEPGSTLELSLSDYLASGRTFTGWTSSLDSLTLSYDKENGKVTVKLPTDGQATISLDATQNAVLSEKTETQVPVTLNGELTATAVPGETVTITAPGLSDGNTLWHASDAGTTLFAGWTKTAYLTSGNAEKSLEYLPGDATARNPLLVHIPQDATSVKLESTTAALPTLQSYLSLEQSASCNLKTLDDETITLDVYTLGDQLSGEVVVKPVFSGEISDALLDACEVEFCITEGNDEDSATAFGYDEYDYETLGDLRSVMTDGAAVTVTATAGSDMAALRKAPRLMLRIRQKATGVTFGYQICTFTCPNYILVNGTPVFAEGGNTITLDPAQFLPEGTSLVGWTTSDDLSVTYDKETGKVTLTLPEDGQAAISLDGTRSALEDVLMRWNVSLKKGWNLVSTGLYTLDQDSLDRFIEHSPWIHVDGTYIPMNEYLPAHAYWIHVDEDETLELSGFLGE